MTNQEAFSAACEHLMRQGRRALAGETCVYRASNGDKCAIGGIFPDECYDVRYEGHNVKALLDADCAVAAYHKAGRLREHLKGVSVDLLVAVQRVHDDLSESITSWPTQLRAVAERLALEVPACIAEQEAML